MLSVAAMAAPPQQHQQQQLPPSTSTSSSSIPSSTPASTVPAKENSLHNSNSSSSTCVPSSVQTSSAFSSRFLRAPLSPIHHNCPPQLSRFSEQSSTPIATTPSAASRRYSRDPSRPVLPSHLSRSPPNGLRSPSSSSISRKLLKEANDTRSNNNSNTRFQKDRNLGPPPMAPLASRTKSSIPPPRPKRQTQQQLSQRVSQDPFSVDHVPSFNNGWADKPESEQTTKPGRRKWRRYPRDVVLRSLRGDPIEKKISTVHDVPDIKNLNSGNKKTISPSGLPYSISRPSEAISRPPNNRLIDAESALSNLKIVDSEPRRSLEKKTSLYCNTKLHHVSSVNSRYGDNKEKSRYSSSTNRSTESAVSIRDSRSTLFSSSDDASSLSSSLYKSNASTKLAAHGAASKPPTPLVKTQVEIPQTSFETETMFTFSTAVAPVLTPPPKIPMSPSLERSLNLTPDDRQLTPPMQSTQSPDFIKREGMRGIVLPMDGKCYAAPGFVKDRRKCKPRGVLTIDGGLEVTSSEESEISLKISQSSQLIGCPPVASVEWMLDGKKPLCGDASPEIVSISTDICRMSFPKLTPQPVAGLSEQDNVCKSFGDDVDADADVVKDGLLCSTQDSMTMSGYEWGATSSQGVHSSCRSDISSVNPRRSIMFDADECLYRSQVRIERTPERLKPNVAHSILFDDGIDKSDLPNMFSDDEGGDGFSVRGLTKPEGSPPFEYLMSTKSGPNKGFKKDNDDDSWAKCVPDEVNLSTSGPLGLNLSRSGQFCSSLSSQDLAASITSVGPLACLQDANAIQKLECSHLDIAAELQEPSSDISSRIAMAKLLCNITATYLDNIVTTLGKGDSASKLKDVVSELAPEVLDDIGPNHSSIIAGRQKMAECCSLLRGLTLETNKSNDTTASNSECSVNQPSPLTKEDNADSCTVRFRNVQESTCNFASDDW